MDEKRLKEIEERAAKTPSGPWEQEAGRVFRYLDWTEAAAFGTNVSDRIAIVDDPAALAFIAHARQDVPDLVAEVRRLNAEREAVLDRLDRLIREANQERRWTVERAWKHIHDGVEALLGGKPFTPKTDLLPPDDSPEYCDGKPYPGRKP